MVLLHYFLFLVVILTGGDFIHHHGSTTTNGKYYGSSSFIFVNGDSIIVEENKSDNKHNNNDVIGSTSTSSSSNMNDNQSLKQQSIQQLRERRLNVIPPTISPIPTVTLYPTWSLSPYPSIKPPVVVVVTKPSSPVVNKPSSIGPPKPINAPSSPSINVPSSVSAPSGGAGTPTGATSPTNDGGSGGGCFSSFNTVHVKDIGDIPINHVKIGDYVKTRYDQFTQVYGFGHYDHNKDEEFLQIIISSVVENNSNHNSRQQQQLLLSLEVTAEHLIHVDRRNNNNQFSFSSLLSSSLYIPASDIVIGDYLNGYIVESIHTVHRRGVYAPLTQSGDLIVNGNIIVSNYINILQHNSSMLMNQQHILGHALFFPQRLLCKYFINTCKKETYINGYGYLAYIIVQIGSYINKYGGGWLTNMIITLICIPFIAIITIIESSTILSRLES